VLLEVRRVRLRATGLVEGCIRLVGIDLLEAAGLRFRGFLRVLLAMCASTGLEGGESDVEAVRMELAGNFRCGTGFNDSTDANAVARRSEVRVVGMSCKKPTGNGVFGTNETGVSGTNETRRCCFSGVECCAVCVLPERGLLDCVSFFARLFALLLFSTVVSSAFSPFPSKSLRFGAFFLRFIEESVVCAWKMTGACWKMEGRGESFWPDLVDVHVHPPRSFRPASEFRPRTLVRLLACSHPGRVR